MQLTTLWPQCDTTTKACSCYRTLPHMPYAYDHIVTLIALCRCRALGVLWRIPKHNQRDIMSQMTADSLHI